MIRRLAIALSGLSLRHLTWPALALLCLIIALVFPGTGGAGGAFLVLAALTGAALAGSGLPQALVRRRPWLEHLALVAVVVVASAALFRPLWNDSGLRVADWGAHHAILRHLVDGLRQGHIPRWVQGLSTGETPYDLYAFFPYYLAAKVAIWFHVDDLTLLMVRGSIFIHTLAAVAAAVLARRVMSWFWAALVGLATLHDAGSVFSGGIDGIFEMGVTHSALSNALWPFALAAIISLFQRPRLATAVGIWLLVALAIACHPLGLVSALATLLALVLVALLARDVPAHRAWAACLHVGIGVLLVAFIWLPFSARVALYGYHYAITGKGMGASFAYLLQRPIPESTIAPLVYAGYVGILVGVLSRRAAPTLIAAYAAILFAGLFDQLYLLAGLAPSVEMARFQTVRLASAAVIAIYTCATYLVATALAAVRPAANTARSPAVAALLALALFGVLRGGLPFLDDFRASVHTMSDREVPDAPGLQKLVTWARAENAAMPPDRFARLFYEEGGNSYLETHINALSGLPTLRLGVVPALFLREKIENASPASLRRFNVRWVVRLDRGSSLGSPETEQRFGRYFVREVPGWDGAFARVERGAGTAVVTHLEDERIEVELRGTDQPALVALGMAFYPRWQAVHEQRGALPVYATPGIPGGKLSVPAAWLPPGRTTFTPSGRLPSDGRGLPFTALGVLAAAAIVVVWWRRPRERARVLRLLARAHRWGARHRVPLLASGAGALAVVLLALSIRSALAVTPALRVGNALSGAAQVSMKVADRWQSCPYAPLYGAYRCDGRTLVGDTLTGLLNDAPPSLPFLVPAISVASPAAAEVRIVLEARLQGEYWGVTNGWHADLTIAGQPPVVLSGTQSVHRFAGGARTATLTATVAPGRPLQIAFVLRSRFDPDRGYVAPPEASPFR